MAYYYAAQHYLLLSPVFKLVSRNRDNRETLERDTRETTERQQRDNRETAERLKRDRKAGLGHKIGLGELNYWRE